MKFIDFSKACASPSKATFSLHTRFLTLIPPFALPSNAVLAQCTPSASTEYSAADCTASRYLTGDVCVLSCADGYATGVDQATAEITCQADGSFSDPPQYVRVAALLTLEFCKL